MHVRLETTGKLHGTMHWRKAGILESSCPVMGVHRDAALLESTLILLSWNEYAIAYKQPLYCWIYIKEGSQRSTWRYGQEGALNYYLWYQRVEGKM